MDDNREMVEKVARAICWGMSEETDDCSSVCMNAHKCMAETVDACFVRDATAALKACNHAELVAENARLREALETLLDSGECDWDGLMAAQDKARAALQSDTGEG